jgi:serine acetyltransferase
MGGLRIEDGVEIGANSTIDRATLGEHRIRRGSKIDNLVHIGHNCDVGEDVILVAQVGETRRIWAAETLLPDLLRRFRALEKPARELEGGRHV